LRVRRATGADAEAIVANLATVAEEGWLATEVPFDVSERVRRIQETNDSAGPDGGWVLEEEARIVGSLGVRETAPGVLALGMAVASEARGRGGGRALLDAALDHARAVGAHKIELEVWPDNARAISLYASAGFEVEGLKRRHYRRRDGSLRSALLMGLMLEPPEASER
jgi:RimJ/RimL family protein N-acetyltransferase